MVVKTPAGTTMNTVINNAKLKLSEMFNNIDISEITDGNCIFYKEEDLYKYQVEFTAENPQHNEGWERWVWLHDNVGEFRRDWDMIPAYSSYENTVYMFKTQDAATMFKLTWL